MRTVLKALASATFVALAAVEVHHDLIARVPWPGYDIVVNNLVFLYGPLWLLAAGLVWVERGPAWLGLVAGALTCLAHGVGVLVGGSDLGVAFLVGGPLAFALAWRGRGMRLGGRLARGPRRSVRSPRRTDAVRRLERETAGGPGRR